MGTREELAGQRVAYTYCTHTKRRFLVVLAEGEEPPQQLEPSASSRERAVEQLARMLQRGVAGLGGGSFRSSELAR